MNRTKQHQIRGFTVIELLVVIVLISAASILFFVQKNNLESANRDEKRKIAINAIYYNLEEVFYPANGHYPATINKEILSAVDPSLLTDTNGIEPQQKIDGDTLSEEEKVAIESTLQQSYEYRYEPTNCNTEGNCKSYTLTVALENEADYLKKSRRN